jgi:hypothetical protein
MDSERTLLPESDFSKFRKIENIRISTVNVMISLLAVVLGALAVLVAVLVALDARTQIDELKIRIQFEKDLRLRAQVKRAEREDWPRENLHSIDIDDDDNWVTNRFRRELELETFDGGQTSVGGTRRRRDSSISGAPIPTCNCDDSEPPRSRNGCCCLKREIDATRKKKFNEIVNRMPAGHFTSCIPSDNDAARLNGTKIGVHLFRSEVKDIFFGSSEPWSTSLKSRDTFQFDAYGHKLKIMRDGLYLIYVQVAKIMFTVGMVEVNNVEWLRCQHRPATQEYNTTLHGGLVMGRESCSMIGVRPMLAGDEIRIRNGEIGFPIVTQPQCTYFGIVKLV